MFLTIKHGKWLWIFCKSLECPLLSPTHCSLEENKQNSLSKSPNATKKKNTLPKKPPQNDEITSVSPK